MLKRLRPQKKFSTSLHKTRSIPSIRSGINISDIRASRRKRKAFNLTAKELDSIYD